MRSSTASKGPRFPRSGYGEVGGSHGRHRDRRAQEGVPAAPTGESVDGVLARVGLAERARDPVRTYSLGMKQRLGIAGALLKDPELLILDEPANGLDPAGIKEVRELLRDLAVSGRTVFLSSHLLT